MGLQENGTQEHESNAIERSEISENLVRGSKVEHMTPSKYKMDCQRFVNVKAEPNVVKHEDAVVKNHELKLDSVKTFSSSENLDEASKFRLMVFKTLGIPPGFESFVNLGDGNLESVQTSAVSVSGYADNVGNLESVQTAAVSVFGRVDNVGNLEPVQTTAVSVSGRVDNVGNLEPVQTAAVNASGKVDNVGNLNPVQTAAVSESGKVDNIGNLEPELTAAVCVSGNVDNGGYLEPVQAVAVSISGNVYNDHTGSSEQLRRQKAKPIVPITSSWSLRSKSQEKPKVPVANDIVKEGSANGDKKKVRKKQLPKKNSVNEYLSMKSRLSYLLHRIKYEQSLIDAYSAEGWKGQSLEKLKPEKELQRAKSHILHYKLKIRALFQRLDTSLAVGKLPVTLFDSKGEIDSEDIFCAKCGSKDVSLDNDIILCDGACERGFHQYCLDPPLLKEDIPPGDEGWLCPGCDCKVDCIDRLKDIQGTKISIIDSWEKIFPEAAAVASGVKPDDGSGFPSDDSEDDDYNPDNPETANKVEGDVSSSDESNYFSASVDLKIRHDNEKNLNLPSEDPEDDDFDPSSVDQDKKVKEASSSSDFTSDSEDLGAILEDDTVPDSGEVPPFSDCGQPSADSKEDEGRLDRMKRPSMKDELSFLMESSEPVSGRRQVERLDYKKLHDETYGNSSSDSSDEDFDNSTTTQKRRKTNPEKTVVETPKETPISKCTNTTNDESEKDTLHTPKSASNRASDGWKNGSAEVDNADAINKESANRRFGEAATQESYGDSSSDSSDKDFDNSTTKKRRKTNPEKAAVETPKETPISKSTNTTNDENQKETEHTPKRTSNRSSDGRKKGSAEVGKVDTGSKKSVNRRLGDSVTKVEVPTETPDTKSTSTTNDDSQKETDHTHRRTSNRISDGRKNGSAEVGKADTSNKKSANRRLGEAVTQRLYASFNENQYPDRAAKETLANELGLKFQQVDKWFGNARWSFNHKPQMILNSTGMHGVGNTDSGKSVSLQESSTIPAENHRRQLTVETLATKGNSSNAKSTNRKDKSNQAPNETMVTNKSLNQKVVSDKAQTQKVITDVKLPQVSSSTRRTRSSRSVA